MKGFYIKGGEHRTQEREEKFILKKEKSLGENYRRENIPHDYNSIRYKTEHEIRGELEDK